VTVKFPRAEFDGKFRVTFCDPADMVNGEAGEIVVPVGSPVTLTDTDPENPFSAVTDTWATSTPPGGTVADVGDTDRAKSGGGGRGDELPPPQLFSPAIRISSADEMTALRTFTIEVLLPK